MESLSIKYEQPNHMSTQLTVGGKPAKVLLDTGTVGTNLMSLNWAQSNGIQTAKMEKPTEIKMATKNSRATANYSATSDVNIGQGRKIVCNFLLVPIGSYDIILGMPFLTRAKVVLDPAESTATFKDHGTTIQCSLTEQTITATAATAISTQMPDLTARHLEHLNSIRGAAAIATEVIQNKEEWNDDEVRETAKTLLSIATATMRNQLPDFQKEFPEVFPGKIPVTLQPLRPGLNHTINLDETRKNEFRNEYRAIPQYRMMQFSNWHEEWKATGIAVP